MIQADVEIMALLESFHDNKAGADPFATIKLLTIAGISVELLSKSNIATVEVPFSLYQCIPPECPRFTSKASGVIARHYCQLLIEKLYYNDLQAAVPSFRFLPLAKSLVQLGCVSSFEEFSPPAPVECPIALPDYGSLAKQMRAETVMATEAAQPEHSQPEWVITRSASLIEAETDFRKVLCSELEASLAYL